MLRQFPFINRRVAELLDKLVAEQTKSRPRRLWKSGKLKTRLSGGAFLCVPTLGRSRMRQLRTYGSVRGGRQQWSSQPRLCWMCVRCGIDEFQGALARCGQPRTLNTAGHRRSAVVLKDLPRQRPAAGASGSYCAAGHANRGTSSERRRLRSLPQAPVCRFGTVGGSSVTHTAVTHTAGREGMMVR